MCRKNLLCLLLSPRFKYGQPDCPFCVERRLVSEFPSSASVSSLEVIPNPYLVDF